MHAARLRRWRRGAARASIGRARHKRRQFIVSSQIRRALLAINGTGNSLDNVIVGTSCANALDDSSGNDTLYGKDGLERSLVARYTLPRARSRFCLQQT